MPLFWTTGTGLSAEPSRSMTLDALRARGRPAASPSTISTTGRRLAVAGRRRGAGTARRSRTRRSPSATRDEVAVVARRGAAAEQAARGAARAGPSSLSSSSAPAGVLAATARRATWLCLPVQVEVRERPRRGGRVRRCALPRTARRLGARARRCAFANAAGALVASRLGCADDMPTARRGRGAAVRGLTKLAPGPGNVGTGRAAGAAAPARSRRARGRSRPASAAPTSTSQDGEYATAPPVTMGHEVSGVVARARRGRRRRLAGRAGRQRDVLLDVRRAARYCRAGRINLCPERRSIGTHVDGAFAPRLLVPATGLHRIPDWLDGRAARAVRAARVRLPLAARAASAVARGRRRARRRAGPGRPARRAGRARRAAARVHVRGTPRDEAAARGGARARLRDESTTDDGPVEADVVSSARAAQAGIAFGARVGAARRALRPDRAGRASR